MIGMYAMYGGSLYNIIDQQLNPNGISIARSNHVEQIFDAANRLARVDVTLANSTGFGRPLTNGEYYASAVEMIKAQKLTEVEKLSSVYRVFLGFMLMDANNVIADEGFMVKDVKPALKYVPLHLDDKNEFLNAFSITFDTRFSRQYRIPVPCGIMATNPPSYKLYITSVSVYQLKADATILRPTDKSRLVPITDYPSGVTVNQYGSQTDGSFRNWNRLVNASRSGMLEQSYSPENDGRMAYTMDPNFVKESACIFNTATDNLKFECVNIGFSPRCVEFNVNIALDGLFVVDSAEDIDQYLKANESSGTLDPSVPGNTEDDDEPVVNPDNPDGKDPNEIPNPENPGSDAGSGNDTPSETPSTGGEDATDPKPTNPDENAGGSTTDPDTPSEGGTETGEAPKDPVEGDGSGSATENPSEGEPSTDPVDPTPEKPSESTTTPDESASSDQAETV